MNLEIPPFRRASTGAFPSVLLQPTAPTPPPPPDGLGIRGLSSEPPAPRPPKRRSGNQDLIENEAGGRSRTRSPEVTKSGRSTNGARSSSGTAIGAGASSTSALAPASSGHSNKRPRSSAESNISNLESLATAASDALQTFPIPNPNATPSLSRASIHNLPKESSREPDSLTPSLSSATREQQQLDGAKRRGSVPGRLEPLNKAVNKLHALHEDGGPESSTLGRRRSDSAASKGLTIATSTQHNSVEAAPRTAPAKVTGPLIPSSLGGREGSAGGHKHGRRGTSFNGQGQFPAHPPITTGRRQSAVGHSLPTPLHAIPISPYTTTTTTTQLNNGAPPSSAASYSSSTRSHQQLAPMLNPTYAPTVTGTYSVPIPPSQHRHSVSFSSSSTHRPPSPSEPHLPTSKQSFLNLFSTFYDSLSDSRVLSRSLEHELVRARQSVSQIDEGWIDSIVRKETERLSRRVMELERIVEDERTEWRARIERLERSITHSFPSNQPGSSSAFLTSESNRGLGIEGGPGELMLDEDEGDDDDAEVALKRERTITPAHPPPPPPPSRSRPGTGSSVASAQRGMRMSSASTSASNGVGTGSAGSRPGTAE